MHTHLWAAYAVLVAAHIMFWLPLTSCVLVAAHNMMCMCRKSSLPQDAAVSMCQALQRTATFHT
jgi:hypothetical protein